MISFQRHVQVKDKYCCFYLGDAPEYVVALKLLRPQIEKNFPELDFYIGCKNSLAYLLAGDPKKCIGNPSDFKDNFAHIRELRNDQDKHSVLEFAEESFAIEPISTRLEMKRGLCLICPEGVPPTSPMKDYQFWVRMVSQSGYTPLVLGSDIHATLHEIETRPCGTEKFDHIQNATWVVGVENEYTMIAASMGKRVTLNASSGVGVSLYKKMFPRVETI